MNTVQTVDSKQKPATKNVNEGETDAKKELEAFDNDIRNLLSEFCAENLDAFVYRLKELVTDLQKFCLAMEKIFEKALGDPIFVDACGILCKVYIIHLLVDSVKYVHWPIHGVVFILRFDA